MVPADKTALDYRQIGKLAQLLSQQSGLVVAALPESLRVQWHRDKHLCGQRVSDKIIMKQLSQRYNQCSKVSVLQLMDSLAHYAVKSEWGTNAIYFCLPGNTAGTEYTAGLGATTSGTERGDYFRQ